MKTKVHKKILAFVLALCAMISIGVSASAVCSYSNTTVRYDLIQECMPNTCGAFWLQKENRYDKVTYMTMPFRERHQREMKQGWCFRNRV